MKVAILYGKEDLRIEERDIPLPGEGEVLVRVKVALTCGTDAKVFLRGGHPRMITPPSPFGHEFAGEVVEVGKGVKEFRPGMRVVAANSAPCFKCYFCKKGIFSQCEDLLFLNGAYAEYIKIPSRIVKTNLYLLPDSLSYEEGAILEPLSCVVHGVEEIGIGEGEWVVIIGAGPIGLLFLLLSKSLGAKVIMVDKNLSRLKKAEEIGADYTLESGEGIVDKVRELTPQGKGADISIEAVGIPQTWEESIKMVRRGGKVLLFGGCAPGTTVTLPTQLLHYGEITIKGVFHHTPEYVRKALEILKDKKIVVKPLLTKKLPLFRLEEALRDMLEKRGIKTVIIP